MVPFALCYDANVAERPVLAERPIVAAAAVRPNAVMLHSLPCFFHPAPTPLRRSVHSHRFLCLLSVLYAFSIHSAPSSGRLTPATAFGKLTKHEQSLKRRVRACLHYSVIDFISHAFLPSAQRSPRPSFFSLLASLLQLLGRALLCARRWCRPLRGDLSRGRLLLANSPPIY